MPHEKRNEVEKHVEEGAEDEYAPRPVGKGQRRQHQLRSVALGHKPPLKDPGASHRLELSYQWERFGLIMKEFPVLFRQHWKEIALNQDKIPLDPDWNRYVDLDLTDVLNVLTVRSNGSLAGYFFVLIHPHLHYCSTVFAMSDIYWLDPLYRNGWTGIKMFRHVEEHCRKRGAKVLFVNEKLHFQYARGGVGKVLKRLGFRHAENIWAKAL